MTHVVRGIDKFDSLANLFKQYAPKPKKWDKPSARNLS